MSVKENPLFSVVIPVYNRKEVLCSALDSVMLQTFDDFEVIVVDDGSTDGLQELARMWPSRVRYLRQEQNKNGATARNIGIKAACGRYVCFLDSDDVWTQNKLKNVAAAIAANNLERVDVVIYHQLFLCENPAFEDFLVRPTVGLGDGDVAEYLFCNDGLIQTSCITVNVELARRCLFDESLRKHQDWDLCINLQRERARFVFINEPLAFWTQFGGQRTSSLSVELSETWIQQKKISLSNRAVEGFEVNFLAPAKLRSGIFFRPAGILLVALIRRDISLLRFVSLFTEFSPLRRIKLGLKRAHRKWKYL